MGGVGGSWSDIHVHVYAVKVCVWGGGGGGGGESQKRTTFMTLRSDSCPRPSLSLKKECSGNVLAKSLWI